ncbi:MAG: hypothetical protein N3D71_01185 [Burkholderiaceae bacterium]|nr:hypothetical protein [Burkholderiaceae bacterium]
MKAFEALDLAGKVPLKLGHEGPDVREDPTTQFAMGWVQRIWREGRKLLADLEVPDRVHELIRQGFLKFVSVELLRNVKASNREIPWVLDAVALLGSDPPAVGVLKDLKALTMTRRAAALQHSGRVAFSRVDFKPLTDLGDKRHMADMTMEQLMEKVLAMQERITALESEKAELTMKTAQLTAVRRQLETLQSDVRRREIEQKRARINELIENAVKAEDILPAARDRFIRTHKVDDDEAVMALTEEDVANFVRENPNPRKAAKLAKKQVFAALSKPTDDVPAGLSVDREGVMRVTAWFKEQGIKNPTADDWVQGTKAVFAQLPEFAERYKAAADAVYDNKV